jgi:hypothetical protein
MDDIPCRNRETKEYPKLGGYCLLTKFRGGIIQGSPCLGRAQRSISSPEMSGKWNSASLSDAGKGRLGAVLHRGTEVLFFGSRARNPYSDWEVAK